MTLMFESDGNDVVSTTLMYCSRVKYSGEG